MSFWDNEAVKKAATNSEFASLKEIGDEVEGTILKLSLRKFNEGTNEERSAIEVIFEGDAPTLTAGQAMLMQGLYEIKPTAGDHLHVALGELQRMGAKTMKRFVITVKRPSGELLELDQRQSAPDGTVRVTPPEKVTAPTRASKAKAAAAVATAEDDEPPF